MVINLKETEKDDKIRNSLIFLALSHILNATWRSIFKHLTFSVIFA